VLSLRRFTGHVVVRNAFWLYLVQISGYLFPLITLPYLTRVLTKETFGEVTYAQTLTWYFITLTDYGFNLTATRRAAACRDSLEELSRLFSAVMVAKALLTALGFLIMSAMVLSWPALRPQYPLFAVAFLSVIGAFLFPVWLFSGVQKLEHVAARDFLTKLLGLGALFALVHHDQDYLWAAGAASGSLALSGVVGLASVPFLIKVRFYWPGWEAVREVLGEGWPAFLSMAAGAFGLVTSVFILGVHSPKEQVADFNAAQRIIGAARALVAPMASAVFPHASLKASRSETEAILFVRRFAPLLAAPFAVGSVILLFVAPFLVPAVLGEQYRSATPALQILAFTPALLALGHVYATCYMLACGYDKQWMSVILRSVGVNFAVFLPLLYFLPGSIALAVATLVAEVFAVFLYWRFYRRGATAALRSEAAR
jgi:PST family polysaccharide transporter